MYDTVSSDSLHLFRGLMSPFENRSKVLTGLVTKMPFITCVVRPLTLSSRSVVEFSVLLCITYEGHAAGAFRRPILSYC